MTYIQLYKKLKYYLTWMKELTEPERRSWLGTWVCERIDIFHELATVYCRAISMQNREVGNYTKD